MPADSSNIFGTETTYVRFGGTIAVEEYGQMPTFNGYVDNYFGIPVVRTGERRIQNMQTVIFGCGGVGSNLAYMLSKHPDVERIYLVDHDIIEVSNLSRQFFIREDVGKNKAEALATTLQQFAPEKEFVALPIKIESEADLGQFGGRNSNYFAFVCTDNVESKALISHYFQYVICLGCDLDLVEMRRRFDRRSVWSVGEGYNSNQTFESNMFAAAIGFMLFIRGHWSVNHKKIQISRLIHELLEKGFENPRREQNGQTNE